MRACAILGTVLLLASPASASFSPYVTGNGFGLAAVSTRTAAVSSFFAHPYSFERPLPDKPLAEGVETADYLKSLAWESPASSGVPALEYVRDSHVISAKDAAGERFVFMPFGLQRNALILDWEGAPAGACLRADWEHPVLSDKEERLSGLELRRVSFSGVREQLLLVPFDEGGGPRPDGCLAGSRAWALISVEEPADAGPAVSDFRRWRGGASAGRLVERELEELEAWRVKPAVKFSSEAERRLWRQSEVVLRLGQSREPDRKDRHGAGLIPACLPDGAWFVAWVRDMAYAAAALAEMGHREEARRALKAYFEARPVGKLSGEVRGRPYQVSVVRYWGDGSEEPFFTMEGDTNVELDNWGLVLWVLGEYADRHGLGLLKERTYRGGTVYESARDFVLAPLLANLDPYEDGSIVAADTSIWEERRKDRKHFAFSTAAAIRGLRGLRGIALRLGDKKTVAEIDKSLPALEKGFRRAFCSKGWVRGTLEEGSKNEFDGAALAAINLGAVDDKAVLRETAERMSNLKMPSGGYRRVRSIVQDPAIFEYGYERQEFVFVDLSLAEVYLRLGERGKAAELLRPIVEKASVDHNHIPEMYVSEPTPPFSGRIGDPTSCDPMVGYGAGAYILHLLAREELTPP